MRILLALFAACALTACGDNTTEPSESAASASSPASTPALSLVPYPAELTRQDGELALGNTADVAINAAAPTAEAAMERLLSDLDITHHGDADTQITLSLTEHDTVGQEGYQLTIGEGRIAIEAQTEAGLFYAVQTLRQLLPAQVGADYTLPFLEITDSPAFSWRGNMLDVARSFLPPAYLKQHIERMARFKLNRLHLHLSDDQGWRVEIEQYPKLTQIGGASAVEGGRSGFYTQEQIRELVAYAQARHVTIVPEIDLPGHTQAAIASYNELACDDVTNLSTYSGLEVGFSKLCLTEPEVIYPWVENVLGEIAELFPSQYIHIGGDEIKDPLYAEFIGRATAMVGEMGRTAIAWEEGSVADNDPSALLQLWNDEYDIQPAIDAGHKLILSPCSYTYFDHGNYAGQPETYDWCRKEGVPLARAYQMPTDLYGPAVGVESAMWSELVHTNATADNRLWPRLAATAELGWTPAEHRDYDAFTERLSQLRGQLDALGIEYYAEPDLGWQ